jgi:hypothetical protein
MKLVSINFHSTNEKDKTLLNNPAQNADIKSKLKEMEKCIYGFSKK